MLVSPAFKASSPCMALVTCTVLQYWSTHGSLPFAFSVPPPGSIAGKLAQLGFCVQCKRHTLVLHTHGCAPHWQPCGKFSPAVILCLMWTQCEHHTCSHVESLCLAECLCHALVLCSRGRARSNGGYKKRSFWKVTLLVSLADRNWRKNRPWQIFSVCMKFGGTWCRDVEAQSSYTATQTHSHVPNTYTNEIMF